MLNERDYMKRPQPPHGQELDRKLRARIKRVFAKAQRNHQVNLWPIIIAGFLVLFVTFLFFKTRVPQPTVSIPNGVTAPRPSLPVVNPYTKYMSKIEDSTAPRPSLPVVNPYAKYMSKIEDSSVPLREVIHDIVQPCPAGSKPCYLVLLYQFVQQRLDYLSDPFYRELIQSPAETLRIHAGDCEDLSILLASLLINSGIPSKLVFTNDHAYVLACAVDPQEIQQSTEQYLLQKTAPKTLAETAEMGPQTMRRWAIPLTQTTPIQWQIESDSPVDALVFPTTLDYNAYLAHQQYQTYTCSTPQIMRSTISCRVAPGSLFALHNQSDRAARATLSLTYPDTVRVGAPRASPKTYTVNGEQCVALDPSIRGAAYPGDEMPKALATSRRAVDIEGNIVVLP